MSGINLMGQLGEKRRNQSYTVKKRGRRSSSKKFNLPSFGGGDLDRKKLLVFLLVILSLFAAKFFLEEEQKKKIRIQQAQLQTLQKKHQQEKSKAQALEEISKAMEDYEKRVNDLREKLGVYERLRKNRNLLVRMVDYAVSEMPDDIWMVTLSTDRDKGEIAVDGFSSTHQKVSEYLAKLSESIFYPNWNLKFIENTAGKAPAGNSKVIHIPPNSKKFSIVSNISEPN